MNTFDDITLEVARLYRRADEKVRGDRLPNRPWAELLEGLPDVEAVDDRRRVAA